MSEATATESTEPTEATETQESLDERTQYDDPWLGSLLRPFLISVMMACVTVALMAFIRHALPFVPLLYTGTMMVLGIGVALLGCVSTTWLAQPRQRMKRNTGYRAAELALILGVTRLATWLAAGYLPPADLLLTRPVDALLDAPYIISLLVVLFAWYMASAMTGDFLRMALQPDEIYAARRRTGRSTDDPAPPNYTDRRGVLTGFMARWLTGGVLLVVLAAGTQVRPAQNGFFAITRQSIDPAVISGTIIYFLSGLVLISQGQLAVLRARWTIERVPSTPAILRHWAVYALGLILAVGVVAALLPFGDTFYLARIISAIFNGTYWLLLNIFQAVLGFLFLIFALLGGDPPEEPEPTPPPPAQPDFQPPPQATGGMPEWIGGSIFWLFLSLLLIYAAYVYVSGRGVQFGWLRTFWLMLRARWQELFDSYQMWQVNRVQARREREEGEGLSLRDRMGNWLRLGNLDPDGQVRYFYLTTLRRAEQAGLPRRQSETPAQYAPRLAQRIREQQRLAAQRAAAAAAAQADGTDATGTDATGTDATGTDATGETPSPTPERETDFDAGMDADEVLQLTDAFINVRYAGRPTNTERLPYLKQLWEALKKKLRRQRT